MDINLPGMNGVECVRQLKQLLPDVQVMMLTVYEDTDNIFNALAAGAPGYIAKRAPHAPIAGRNLEKHSGGTLMAHHKSRENDSFLATGSTVLPAHRESLTARAGSAGLPGPGFPLQRNRRETGDQLRNGSHLHPSDLRKAPGPNPDRGRGEVSSALIAHFSPRSP